MFFSVITPIYNNKNFIRRGIQSLLAQTFTDYEVILVDDSSTDGSGKLCDEVAKEYPNIKIIHQKNTGAGGARNAGIKAAQGKYLAFFDIDDLVAPNWLETIHRYIKEYHPQMIVSGYEEYNTRYKTTVNFSFDFAFYETNTQLKSKYIDTLSGLRFNNGFVWNKVFERDFIVRNNIRFPDLRIQQDEVFNLRVYPLVERVLVVPDIFYKYFVYYKGNTASHYIPERLDIYRAVRDSFLELCDRWVLQDDQFNAYIYKRFYNSLLHDINFNLCHPDNGLTKKDKKQKIKDIMNDEDIQCTLKELKRFKEYPKTFMELRLFNSFISKNVNEFYLINKFNEIISILKSLVK